MKAIEGYDKLRGGYYTPPDISEFIIRWANLSVGNSILEPSCGDGSFFAAIRKICSTDCSNNVIGIELDPAEADKARKYGYTVLQGDFFLTMIRILKVNGNLMP